MTALGTSHTSRTSTPRVVPGPRVTGRVWWFCPDRGFGWVRDEHGQAWFTTWNDLPGRGFRTLDEGTAVSFRTDRDRHGPVARDVHVEAPRRLAG